MDVSGEKLSELLSQKELKTVYVIPAVMPFRVDKRRVALSDEVLESEGIVNTDMHPIAYLFDITWWSTHFNKMFRDLVFKVERIPFVILFMAVVLF